MIDRSNHIPLYIQLKEEIAKKIQEGVFEVDSQIPTEKELMEKHSLGRATVREAISHLVNEGYLYKKQGIGTFVASRKPSIGIGPLISLTYPLEAVDIHPTNLIIKSEEIEPAEGLLETMKWNKKKSCFYLERVRYAQNRPLALEYSYFDNSFKKMENICDLKGSLAKIIIKEMKLNITKVEQVIVPRLPNAEEICKLSLEDKAQVFELKRWIYIEGMDEPFYYLKFITPGDIFNITF